MAYEGTAAFVQTVIVTLRSIFGQEREYRPTGPCVEVLKHPLGRSNTTLPRGRFPGGESPEGRELVDRRRCGDLDPLGRLLGQGSGRVSANAPPCAPAAGLPAYTSGWTMMSAMTQAPEFDIELSAARSVRTLRASLSGELPANAIALKLADLEGTSGNPWLLTAGDIEEEGDGVLVLTFTRR